jgi:hypothetical protein
MHEVNSPLLIPVNLSRLDYKEAKPVHDRDRKFAIYDISPKDDGKQKKPQEIRERGCNSTNFFLIIAILLLASGALLNDQNSTSVITPTAQATQVIEPAPQVRQLETNFSRRELVDQYNAILDEFRQSHHSEVINHHDYRVNHNQSSDTNTLLAYVVANDSLRGDRDLYVLVLDGADPDMAQENLVHVDEVQGATDISGKRWHANDAIFEVDGKRILVNLEDGSVTTID